MATSRQGVTRVTVQVLGNSDLDTIVRKWTTEIAVCDANKQVRQVARQVPGWGVDADRCNFPPWSVNTSTDSAGCALRAG